MSQAIEEANRNACSGANTYNYNDCSNLKPMLSDWMSLQENMELPPKKRHLPLKLYEILGNNEFSRIIAWMQHGRSWIVLDTKRLSEEVIPHYFENSGGLLDWVAFFNVVEEWGFRKIKRGNEIVPGAYYHEMFLRGKPYLLARMTRPKTIPSPANIQESPNFDEMHIPDRAEAFGVQGEGENQTNLTNTNDDTLILTSAEEAAASHHESLAWGQHQAAAIHQIKLVQNQNPPSTQGIYPPNVLAAAKELASERQQPQCVTGRGIQQQNHAMQRKMNVLQSQSYAINLPQNNSNLTTTTFQGTANQRQDSIALNQQQSNKNQSVLHHQKPPLNLPQLSKCPANQGVANHTIHASRASNLPRPAHSSQAMQQHNSPFIISHQNIPNANTIPNTMPTNPAQTSRTPDHHLPGIAIQNPCPMNTMQSIQNASVATPNMMQAPTANYPTPHSHDHDMSVQYHNSFNTGHNRSLTDQVSPHAAGLQKSSQRTLAAGLQQNNSSSKSTPDELNAQAAQTMNANGIVNSHYTFKCRICDRIGSKRCSGCKKAYYCSVEHQASDWEAHRMECFLGRISKTQFQKNNSSDAGQASNALQKPAAEKKPKQKDSEALASSMMAAAAFREMYHNEEDD